MSALGIAPSGYFDRWYADRDWRAYRWILARVVEYAEPGPLLDLGAGPGYLVDAARRWGMEAVGLEGSDAAFEFARRLGLDVDVRRHALADPLPFGDGSFAAVVMNQVIEHLSADTAAAVVAEAHRVLASGGVLVVNSPSRANRREADADPTHMHLFAPSELAQLLLGSGFARVDRHDLPLSPSWGGKLGAMAATVLFRVLPRDSLSATANAVAVKTRS